MELFPKSESDSQGPRFREGKLRIRYLRVGVCQALTDAVEMRMRAKRGETSLPKGPKLSELDLNDPQRTLVTHHDPASLFSSSK